VPQDSGCKFLCEHTEATATCIIYINRLSVMNFTEAPATFISYQLHVSTEALAPFISSTTRLPPRPWMVAHDSSRIYPNKIDLFDWFIPSLLDGLAGRATSTTS
jgi:hypothetical protein